MTSPSSSQAPSTFPAPRPEALPEPAPRSGLAPTVAPSASPQSSAAATPGPSSSVAPSVRLSSSAAPSSSAVPFYMATLRRVVDDDSITSCGWYDDGRSFVISDEEAFIKHVLPDFSKTRDMQVPAFHNFKKTVVTYGFSTNQCYVRGVLLTIFTSPNFQRDRPELLHGHRARLSPAHARQGEEVTSRRNRAVPKIAAATQAIDALLAALRPPTLSVENRAIWSALETFMKSTAVTVGQLQAQVSQIHETNGQLRLEAEGKDKKIKELEKKLDGIGEHAKIKDLERKNRELEKKLEGVVQHSKIKDLERKTSNLEEREKGKDAQMEALGKVLAKMLLKPGSLASQAQGRSQGVGTGDSGVGEVGAAAAVVAAGSSSSSSETTGARPRKRVRSAGEAEGEDEDEEENEDAEMGVAARGSERAEGDRMEEM